MPTRPPDPVAGPPAATGSTIDLASIDPPRIDPATIDLPLQTRADVRLMPESVDAERRTIELVWSTGAAVRRRDPWTA